MKKKSISLYAVLLLLVYACHSGKNKVDIQDNNSVRIKIDLNANDPIEIKNYFRYTSFIALETTNENLISQIDKIEFFEHRIYILDSKMGCVFIFDDNGTYLNKIDRKGQGSEEYITADDFIIDSQNNKIQIYDGTLGHIMSYGFSGKFIDKLNVEKGYCFTNLKNGNWLFYLANGTSNMNGSFYNLKLYDRNFQFVAEYLPFNRSLVGHKYTADATKSIFSKYSNETFILPLLSNTIYSFNEKTNNIESRYKITFSEGMDSYIDEKSTSLEVDNFRSKLSNGNIASNIHNFYKIDSIVFFRFFYQNRLFFCLFDEITNEVKCSGKTIFDNNGLFFSPAIYYSDKGENSILSIVDSGLFEIAKQMDKTENPVINEIEKSLKGTDDANPILIFYDRCKN